MNIASSCITNITGAGYDITGEGLNCIIGEIAGLVLLVKVLLSLVL